MKDKVKLEMDNAFMPTVMNFTWCDRKVRFFTQNQNDSLMVECTDLSSGDSFNLTMPFHAKMALAQMLLGCLNGASIIKKVSE